jgi:uncharacterized protein YndB with AHSA1/START domain
MSSYDWSRFTVKINIKTPLSSIYLAWTNPYELEKWFLRRALFFNDGKAQPSDYFIQKGDTYEWYWHGYGDDIVEKGKVLYADGLQKLQFSFTKGAIVTVDIGEVAGDMIVMLTQEDIPTSEEGKVKYHMGCKEGWTFYLANLKSYLEGGIDLRNKNMALSGVINS